MPREQYNALLEQLLDEIKRSGREIKKGKRLMIVGNDVHNSNWIAAIEELDAVVVTDEMNIGTRYFWGKVDTSLPPMEGIARHYIFNRPQDATIYESNRYDHIFKLAKEYKVDGVVSEVVRYCAPLENDKPSLKKEMDKRGIPVLELSLEYWRKRERADEDTGRGFPGDAAKLRRSARRDGDAQERKRLRCPRRSFKARN